jgi:hypothetical protein
VHVGESIAHGLSSSGGPCAARPVRRTGRQSRATRASSIIRLTGLQISQGSRAVTRWWHTGRPRQWAHGPSVPAAHRPSGHGRSGPPRRLAHGPSDDSGPGVDGFGRLNDRIAAVGSRPVRLRTAHGPTCPDRLPGNQWPNAAPSLRYRLSESRPASFISRAHSVGSPFCRALGRTDSDGPNGTFGGWPSSFCSHCRYSLGQFGADTLQLLWNLADHQATTSLGYGCMGCSGEGGASLRETEREKEERERRERERESVRGRERERWRERLAHL